jgi:mevalonate kinase
MHTMSFLFQLKLGACMQPDDASCTVLLSRGASPLSSCDASSLSSPAVFSAGPSGLPPAARDTPALSSRGQATAGQSIYKSSAPGSLMLLGEYAVLHGKPALVCAVDKRITVTLKPRTDTNITITSSTLGSFSTDLSSLSKLELQKPFQFVIAVLRYYQGRLKHGCDLAIEAEFSDKIGLGSSAAVTAAMLAAITTWLDIKTTSLDLVRHGCIIVRSVQGLGSGADIAAAVYGGLVNYSAQPLSVEKIAVTLPLHAIYAGFKTPTVDAIQQVQNRFSAYPNLFRSICQSIGQCAIEGAQFARKQDWFKLGEVMNAQQGMMEALGVSLPILQDMVQGLRKQAGIVGAKISGSGLGDCVIGLGSGLADLRSGLRTCILEDDRDDREIADQSPRAFHPQESEKSEDPFNNLKNEGVQRIPVAMTLQGVYCEKI